MLTAPQVHLHSNASQERLMEAFRARIDEAPQDALFNSTAIKGKDGKPRPLGSAFGAFLSNQLIFAVVIAENGVSSKMHVELSQNDLGGTTLRCSQKVSWQSWFALIGIGVAILGAFGMVLMLEPDLNHPRAQMELQQCFWTLLALPVCAVMFYGMNTKDSEKHLKIIKDVLEDVKERAS